MVEMNIEDFLCSENTIIHALPRAQTSDRQYWLRRLAV